MDENEIRKASQNPFKVKIWAGSHGLKSHYFPQELEKSFTDRGLLRLPEIDAVDGRLLDENFIDYYRREFESESYSTIPQVSIILMSDTNIRRHAIKGAFRAVQAVKELIKIHKDTIHPLLICGPMPCPRTDQITGILSEHTEDRFQKMIVRLHKKPTGRFFGYVCVTSFFIQNEFPPLITSLFARDGIHLNREGAKVLSISLVAHANTLVQSVLSYQDMDQDDELYPESESEDDDEIYQELLGMS